MKGNKYTFFIIFLGGLVSLSANGCSVFRPVANHYIWSSYRVDNIQVNQSIRPDSTILAILAPYRKHVHEVMDKVVGNSGGIFKKGKPDGSLGNLVADAIRIAAGNITGKAINIGVITNSSLQSGIKKGRITYGTIYNVMPYNNHLVILQLTGSQVEELVNEIASVGGEPVSGIRMSIVNGQSQAVLVGDQVINEDSTYTVATNNYVADGGGDMPALWNPVKRTDLSLSIRQAIVGYIEDRFNIYPVKDGRIR